MRSEAEIRARISDLEAKKAILLSPWPPIELFRETEDTNSVRNTRPGGQNRLEMGEAPPEQVKITWPITLEGVNAELAALRWALDGSEGISERSKVG